MNRKVYDIKLLIGGNQNWTRASSGWGRSAGVERDGVWDEPNREG